MCVFAIGSSRLHWTFNASTKNFLHDDGDEEGLEFRGASFVKVKMWHDWDRNNHFSPMLRKLIRKEMLLLECFKLKKCPPQTQPFRIIRTLFMKWRERMKLQCNAGRWPFFYLECELGIGQSRSNSGSSRDISMTNGVPERFLPLRASERSSDLGNSLPSVHTPLA